MAAGFGATVWLKSQRKHKIKCAVSAAINEKMVMKHFQQLVEIRPDPRAGRTLFFRPGADHSECSGQSYGIRAVSLPDQPVVDGHFHQRRRIQGRTVAGRNRFHPDRASAGEHDELSERRTFSRHNLLLSGTRLQFCGQLRVRQRGQRRKRRPRRARYPSLAGGTTTDGEIDVPSGLTNGVVAISAGFYHSLALKNDGTVVGWGTIVRPSDAADGTDRGGGDCCRICTTAWLWRAMARWSAWGSTDR